MRSLVRTHSLALVHVAIALSLKAGVCAYAQGLPDLKTADALGAELYAASSSTGMVMVVVRGGGATPEVMIRGYGETAPGSGQVPRMDSVVRLCSLSKIFATDVLTKLALDGTLRLSDPLQKFAPSRVVVPSRPGHPITLVDLATHTSGLPREVGNAPRGTPHFTFPGYRYRWKWLPAQRLKSVPGTAALYSNVGFDLLGDALEKAAGEPYARLLAERTTGPLGMHETGFTPNAGQCARLLKGNHDEGPCTDTQNSAGSAGVYSTAADMASWLKYLMGLGAVVQNPAAQAVYIEPGSLVSESGLDHAGVPTGIGLGWMHVLGPDTPEEIVEKTGGGAGFTTYIALNQAHHVGLFVAFTDGPSHNHFNVFKAANNVVLQLSGLPPLPPEPTRVVKPVHRAVRKRTAVSH